MKIWNQAPLVRLFLPFVAGIITAIVFDLPFENLFPYVILLALFVSVVILIPKFTISYKKTLWVGLLINLILFLSAYELTILKTEKFSPNQFSKFTDSISYTYARLTEPYLIKEKSLKVIMEIKAIKKGNKWKSTSGKVIAYIQKNKRSLQLDYGDELFIKTNFTGIPPPQNPGEFNYKRFLAFQNIYQQSYLKDEDWVNSGKNSANPVIKYCIDLRNKLLTVLTSHHIKGDEFSVGAALLLGYEDQLDADIISSYASTGALHVLSVSGLHVAIVYMVFNWLLFFFNKIKHGNIYKAILLILILWFYAALTGLSPSVLRAATMFSFIVIAKAFNRYTNIYNTLATSAFLLLVIDPYLIMNVGFQLSYLAVIGIIYIQPKLYNRFDVNNHMLNEIWKITTVSIAAQIATFPLGLYYFHQFPNYFLLSNFIVIPVSSAIIYLGIALFVLAPIQSVSIYIATGFKWSVWFLNTTIKTIEQWPYALLQGISTTVFDTILIYTLIILLLYYIHRKKLNYLLAALLVVTMILFSQMLEQCQQYGQKKLIIYNIPKTSALDFVSAKSNVLLTDSVFAKNERSLLFHVKQNWRDLGINNTKIISGAVQTKYLRIKNNFIQFYNKRIVIINDKIQSKSLMNPFPVDYLVISGNPHASMQMILKNYQADKIIFDSSNSNYRIKKWEKECEVLNLAYYSVTEQGAFISDL